MPREVGRNQLDPLGTSGWSYDHWVEVLYPRTASSLERLEVHARKFTTVEVNNTFYRWPTPEVFARWLAGSKRRGHRGVVHRALVGSEPALAAPHSA